MTERIENQIERFAPGFKDCIHIKKATAPSDLRKNPDKNYSGGDISGGAMNWKQLFTRPINLFRPYKTPLPEHIYAHPRLLPGRLHGMCGYHAAKLALKEIFGA